MKFKTLLNHIFGVQNLHEAPEQVGTSEKKERAKSGATDYKAKDAARKRIERAKQLPRERKPKQELIKDVILVKARNGSVQLIFKDSFNASQHTKLNKDVMSMEEAQRATREEGFEQTRASKLLFGDVKAKETAKKEEKERKTEEKREKEEAKPRSEEERKTRERTKAKRMTKEQMFETMAQMTPEQLSTMPPELRMEFFKMIRKPEANSDFDKLSYENISVEFGLSNISNSPFSQQVLNALMFLAKLKVGASEQELQTYFAMAPDTKDFTRSAFFTAKKILSQIGDECLQQLLSNVETGGKPVNSEGNADMECGGYRFKIMAGGEISLSTTEFNQSNKNFKGYISKALTQVLMNPAIISKDKKLSEIMNNADLIHKSFNPLLIPDNLIPEIQKDAKLLKKLQGTAVVDESGKAQGTVIDKDGNLNPLASLLNYQKLWQDTAKKIVKSGSQDLLKTSVINGLLKTVLRGDGINDPEKAPNHLITVNGIFPMTDEYFDTISRESTLDIKPSRDVITSSNIIDYKPKAAELLKSFATVVESIQQKNTLESMFVSKDKLNPMEIIASQIAKANDFLLNASLLPGFSVKDLNAVQYNYVKIGKKTVKIPVMKGENITNSVLGECVLVLNDILVESLTNNFVLTNLLRNHLITDSEAEILITSQNLLTEDVEPFMINFKSIFENAKNRMLEYPELAEMLFIDLIVEEAKRNYKMEYRNYHGKPKQRKERAARTKAREMMIKKGRVRKGDGKDIDHKRPLRNGGSKGINNLRVRDKSENRSDNGHKEGEKQSKDWK